eukprot:CAMPEP_0177611448 /NCGR_PEP_ID=MMETSP0419_2-20121207/20495_1 /TAXON_ID=582737 /ORGANISM="Tetraselmis sp., Strain GSL018" /LENGTH=387 /DNA_ID=CAMNT_0019107175 /DNA_START=628 /DNA_END=1788 /DNA_ORIENTATION=+
MCSHSSEGSGFVLAKLLPAGHCGMARPRRRLQFASVSLAGSEAAKDAKLQETPEEREVAMKPASDVLAGAIARAASQSTIHPLDTLKVRMQTSSLRLAKGLSKIGQLVPPAPDKSKLSHAISRVGSLYRGVAGAASGAGIALGAYFACYGVATNSLLQHTDLPAATVAFVAGGVAAAGSCGVKVPLAVCIRSVQADVYPNAFAAARSIIASAGVRGLFTGFVPTMLEDVPDMAFKFAAYESLRQLHSSLNGGRKANPTEDFAMGAAAGAFAAAATTPLDVIKTNMMCNAGSRPSMVSACKAVFADGGMAAFGRGLGPRALSNGINSAVFFCFFEAIRRRFANQAVEERDSGGHARTSWRGSGEDAEDLGGSHEYQPHPASVSITAKR